MTGAVPMHHPLALFAPPVAIASTVHLRLPDALRLQGRRSAWAQLQRPGHDTHSFLEGPTFDAAGRLYLVDIAHGRVLRVERDDTVEVVAQYDGEPNGLAMHPDGRRVVADYRLGILVLDPGSGRLETFLDRDGMDRLKGPNDLLFSRDGELYFTDQGSTGWQDPTGRVYRLGHDGRLDRLLENAPSPNGLALTPDEGTLMVAVTRANALWRVPLRPRGGRISKVGTFVQLSGGIGPDGLAMHADGRLAVAHFGLGCAWVFSALGVPLACVQSCAGLGVTNVAWGGEDGHTLYMTESETGTVLQARVPPLPS